MGGRRAAVSAAAFSICLVLGAAAIAVWIYARWPRIAPSRLQVVVAHVVVALVVGYFSRSGIAFLASFESLVASFVAVFAVALPALTYNLLVAFWVLAVLAALSRRG
jgi:hypothetical protein